MELDAIAVFVKVVEAGSFSEAARLLKMPKTTVSAKVATLERRLGVTLIQRTTRKLHMTDAGQNFFRHCAIAISEIEKGESELSAGTNKPRGVLKVTAPADLGHTLLPRIVCTYRKAYPDVQLDLVVTNRIVDLVGEGIDLAIRAGELKDSSLIAKKFFENSISFWAAPAYIKKYGQPSHPNDLLKHDFIEHVALKNSPIVLTDGKLSVTLQMKPMIKVDDFETLKALLVLKEGIGLLPSFVPVREQKTKELVQLLPKWSLKNTSGFSFVYPSQKYSSPKVRAFIDTAIELAKEIC
jgi:DNA-binding transcriptional LysR family regulator